MNVTDWQQSQLTELKLEIKWSNWNWNWRRRRKIKEQTPRHVWWWDCNNRPQRVDLSQAQREDLFKDGLADSDAVFHVLMRHFWSRYTPVATMNEQVRVRRRKSETIKESYYCTWTVDQLYCNPVICIQKQLLCKMMRSMPLYHAPVTGLFSFLFYGIWITWSVIAKNWLKTFFNQAHWLKCNLDAGDISYLWHTQIKIVTLTKTTTTGRWWTIEPLFKSNCDEVM